MSNGEDAFERARSYHEDPLRAADGLLSVLIDLKSIAVGLPADGSPELSDFLAEQISSKIGEAEGLLCRAKQDKTLLNNTEANQIRELLDELRAVYVSGECDCRLIRLPEYLKAAFDRAFAGKWMLPFSHAARLTTAKESIRRDLEAAQAALNAKLCELAAAPQAALNAKLCELAAAPQAALNAKLCELAAAPQAALNAKLCELARSNSAVPCIPPIRIAETPLLMRLPTSHNNPNGLIRLNKSTPQDQAGAAYPLRIGYGTEAPEAVLLAVRTVIADWDGRNWVAVRHCLQVAMPELTATELDRWTMDDVQQRFAIGQNRMRVALGGTANTTNATIAAAEVGTVSVASAVAKSSGGRPRKTKREPHEKKVMNCHKQGMQFLDIDRELKLEFGESRRIYEAVTRRERRRKKESADESGQI